MHLKSKVLMAGFSLFLLMAVTNNCFAQRFGRNIKGNGNIIKENRNVSDFTKLEISGAFKVFMVQGTKPSLAVEADENLMERIITTVKGGRLDISSHNVSSYNKMVIYLCVVDLDELDISGAVTVIGETELKFRSIHLDFSGASRMDADMIAEKINVDISGASKINLAGNCRTAEVDASGASKFLGTKFKVDNLSADVSGASFVEICVKDDMEVEVSGTGKLRYEGNPRVRQSTSGLGKIVQL
ncbi:MAG: head GIN domain-containing protein [Bacteroidales bacterium]|nr:head GIN domain-containing protein [Bacteroidales bacterium]